MNQQLSKSFSHLFKLIKIYSIIALFGAFIATMIGLMILSPIIGSVVLAIFVMLIVQIGQTSIALPVPGKYQPTTPLWILNILLPREARELTIGDFHEEYFNFTKKVGRRSAKLWLWKEVLISIMPLIRWRIKKGISLGYSGDTNDNVKESLPFYRVYKKAH